MSKEFDFLRGEQLALERDANNCRAAGVLAGIVGVGMAALAVRFGMNHEADLAFSIGAGATFFEGNAVLALHAAAKQSTRAAMYEAATLTPEYLPELVALKQGHTTRTPQ